MRLEYIIAIAVALSIIAFFTLKKRRDKMPVGMQVFNSSGKTVFDSSGSNRYGRIIGRFTISASPSNVQRSGSHTASGLNGVPFFIVPGRSPEALSINQINPLSVNFNGSIINWTYSGTEAITIYYGVF